MHLRRNASGYVGLRNGGATCYMNSVFQQLFMQPSIRQLILAGPEEAPDKRADSVFYQMQVCSGSQGICISFPQPPLPLTPTVVTAIGAVL